MPETNTPEASTPEQKMPQQSMRQVLANRQFFRLWLGQVVSIFGDFLAMFAVYSVVSFKMHGTAAQVSLVSVSVLAPMALIGPVAGVLVDRWNVKRTMVASDLLRGCLVLYLLFATSLPSIYAIFFVIGSISSFFYPAQSVTTPSIVAREGLLGASAIMQQSMQLGRIVSPTLAGVLVASFGERSCYYLDSFSFFFSAAMISTLVIPRAPHAERHMRSVLGDLFSGIRFILGHPAISFVILSMAAGVFALSCFGALIAVYVRDVLHGASTLFGVLASLIGVGTILGGAFVGRLARTRSRTHLVTFGILLVGVFIFGLTAVATRAASVIGCLGIGFGVAFILIPASALLQEETPLEMRGRVSSSSMSLMTMVQALAMILAGSAAARFGIAPILFLSAAMLLSIAAFGYWTLRRTPSAA
ncbi:MAG: MFS transporter [Bryobacteraceae bacterium]